MQVHVETLSPVSKKVSFEIPVEQVNTEIANAYAGIQKRAKLQGFRPGKAPMRLIKRTFIDSMRDEVMRRFYEKTLFQALSENKIEPIETPTIECDLLQEDAPFKYSALVEVMPEFELKDYEGLEITRERFVFDPQKVDDEIGRMRNNMAQLIPLEDDVAVEKGHMAVVDFTFTVEGFPEEDSSSEGSMVEVGAHRFSPEFEDGLLGMKCGESKKIGITLPEGYRNPEAAGKEGVFHVTLKELKRKELPELDDEFARQFGDFETVEQLREKIEEYHRKYELERIEHDQKTNIIKALIEKNPIEVPQSMVRRQQDRMLEELKNRLQSRGMSMNTMGMNDDTFREHARESAADKVRGGLLLMALIKQEDFAVTDEDLEKRYAEIAAGNEDLLTRIREHYSTTRSARESLISEMKEDKAIRFLLDRAVITEIDPAASEAPEA